jgi:hypothetical protein
MGASLLVALVLASACAVSRPTGQRTAKGVIFPAVQIEEFSQRSSFFNLPGPYWTPTVADVAQLEDKLEVYLRNSGVPRADVVLADLDSSKRQYLGYGAAGRRMVFINGLCAAAAHDPAWQTRLVVVLDGGPCFYQAHYDVQAATFVQLSISGEA